MKTISLISIKEAQEEYNFNWTNEAVKDITNYLSDVIRSRTFNYGYCSSKKSTMDYDKYCPNIVELIEETLRLEFKDFDKYLAVEWRRDINSSSSFHIRERKL